MQYPVIPNIIFISCPPGDSVLHPTFPSQAVNNHKAGLGVSDLDSTVCALVKRGVANATLMAYASGKRRYLSFCAQFHYKPLPVEESTLLRFVAFLFSSSLSYSSIRLYLCTIHHLQIMGNLPDLALTAFPKLNYALRGLRREGPQLQTCPRLPITPELLTRCGLSDPRATTRRCYGRLFAWVFFAFLRSGEFTCPSWETYTPDMLSPGDVLIDSHAAPSHVAIHLKRSKMTPLQWEQSCTWVSQGMSCVQLHRCWGTWRFDPLPQGHCSCLRMAALSQDLIWCTFYDRLCRQQEWMIPALVDIVSASVRQRQLRKWA